MANDKGIAIEITIDDASIRGALDALQRFPSEMYPALDAIGAAMEAKTRLRFREETDPDGKKWLPSQRAIKTGGQTLTKSGRLRDSITYNTLPGMSGVEWGSNMVYAAIHQFGGKIKRAARTQAIYRKVSKLGELGNRFVKKRLSNFMTQHAVGAYDINMPQRAFLGIDAEDKETIAQILAKALQKSIILASGAKP